MARQRAGQARAAFARVGTAPVSEPDGENASLSASENASLSASENASLSAVPMTGGKVSDSAHGTASSGAGTRAGRPAGKKAGKRGRRVGRPRGPDRVPLTIRILDATDERLTAAVDITGESPQYIVEAALGAYFDALDIT
jgi:hypothetical protein